ncbi:MAG: YidC/Oxa1 family membrane protein insertase [Mycobacterium leprae]
MFASVWAPEWIIKPMASLLTWFVSLTGSYGLGIILLTLVVRVVILPLTIYQMKGMKKMQEVQPLLKEIQEKYKDQPEKLNQEMMQLYKTQGVNPFAGCLPLLIQMPFLWAIFAVLQAYKPPVEIGTAFLFMGPLSAPHQIFLTAVTIVSMLAQSYLTGAATDPNQKMMMYMMPILFGWMSWSMAGGVVLYWVVSTIFGIVQQAIYPGFPRLKGGAGLKGEAGAR